MCSYSYDSHNLWSSFYSHLSSNQVSVNCSCKTRPAKHMLCTQHTKRIRVTLSCLYVLAMPMSLSRLIRIWGHRRSEKGGGQKYEHGFNKTLSVVASAPSHPQPSPFRLCVALALIFKELWVHECRNHFNLACFLLPVSLSNFTQHWTVAVLDIRVTAHIGSETGS